MSFGPGDDQDRDNRPEYAEFGSRRRTVGRGAVGLVLACLAIAAVVVAVSHAGPRRPAQLPPVSVVSVGHPVLGITAGWQLFGLSQRSVVDIQLRTGRVITTALPPPQGSGPVSFIVGPHAAIVRPLDDVTGYLVPDGSPARPLTGTLARGGLLLPGPSAAQEWDTLGRPDSLILIGADGKPTGTRITLPGPWALQAAMPDGRGDVLVASNSGEQYDAGPHWLHTIGILPSAVGPRAWLGETCTTAGCRDVVVDPLTGRHRVLPGVPPHLLTWPWPAYPGSVAPDGSVAALVAGNSRGQVSLVEINLVTGAVRRLRVPVTQSTSSATMAWSPDSAWLFVVSTRGKLLAVAARTGQVRTLGLSLPAVSQLGMRG